MPSSIRRLFVSVANPRRVRLLILLVILGGLLWFWHIGGLLWFWLVLWEVATGNEQGRLIGHTDVVVTARSTSDGTYLVWKLPTPPAPPEPFNTSRMQLVVDSHIHAFPRRDDATWKSGPLAENEWQFTGQKTGWSIVSGTPLEKVSEGIADFVFEATVRLPQSGKGEWWVEFGGHTDDPPGDSNRWRFWLCVLQDGQVGVRLRPWSKPPGEWLIHSKIALRDQFTTQFNDCRLEVVAGHARVFVNGGFIGERDLESFRPSRLNLWQALNEAPFDVRFRRIRLWRPE